MANKATREQVLGVVEQFFGSESAMYGWCVSLLDGGKHPNEVLMVLRGSCRKWDREIAGSRGDS